MTHISSTGGSATARLSLVTLGVTDLARAVTFYEGLGFLRRGRAYEGVAFFQAGGAVLSLYPRADLAADAGLAQTGGPGGFSGIALACNQTDETAVDAFFAHALALGATVLKRPQPAFWGGYGGYFADPDGHVWEVAFNPLAPFDGQGNLILPD